MVFIPNTDDDRRDMLKLIGVDTFEELIDNIPSSLRMQRPLQIPQLSEMELLREIEGYSKQNREGLICFAGGGVYDHFIPAAEDTIISRPEFMTAYTPYQAEVAQGTLQVIYEFQSHICRLTGMEVANASMYDGATAAAEAAIMAMRINGRDKLVVSQTLNPIYREVIQTYVSGREVEIVTAPMKDGVTDLERLKDLVDDGTACVLVSQPNFFGLLEDVETAGEIVHAVGGVFIMNVDPISQAVLKRPSECGADIVVGEGQPLGVPLSFGGPLLGFFAARKELARQMPGRISGRTRDVDGKTGFTLILQTKEQHIRREKATSNICTNQALCATAAAVYMTLLGKQGLKQVALLSMENAHNLREKIVGTDGYEPYFEGPFVREFAIRTPIPAQDVILSMLDKSILPGIDAGRWYQGMDNCLIVAATEKRTDEEIDRLVDGLKELHNSGVLSRM